MRRVLDRLHPPGSAWRIIGDLAMLMEGIADTLERARMFLRAGLAESLPLTASDMLPEWHAALGQRYDPTQTLEYQRRMLDAIWTAFGGVTLNQLNAQMHKELPDVDIAEIIETDTTTECGVGELGLAECGSTLVGSEVNPFIYDVAGEVANDVEAARVIAVLQHFAPLHLTPRSSLTILTDTGTAECGLATVGIAECASTG